MCWIRSSEGLFIPDYCEIGINRRNIPGEPQEKVYEELAEIISRLSLEDEELKAELQTLLPGEFGTKRADPMETPLDAKIVKIFIKAVKDVTGQTLDPSGSSIWTDGAILVNEGKIPTIIFGPGEPHYAHARNEQIRLKDVVESFKIYVRVAQLFFES
ncbi:MAG: hypothetical protein DRJ31_08965 [Candidatus Methanomethylicota archaeon]|uniref:Peptidase M20 dimerisation domain-containing protein n=1 Tax=Thermoproteota archaeon TaxID=2056631 RepID=A0A497EMI3_9CREN|nr:MAG: hypothetical protein DRJ31_08965 [Candidatus Verstraetearchaeota archaeon]